MTWLVLVVLAAGTYRVARLVSTDEVTAPLRHAMARRWPPSTKPPMRWQTGQPVPDAASLVASWPVRLVSCEWCTAVWVAGAMVLGAHYCGLVHTWAWTGYSWPAVATGSGLVTRVVG